MSTGITPAPAPAPARNSFGTLFADWYRSEGLSWIFILKAVAAGVLALYIGMRLELPSPRTALTTVFIVMTPQSGGVLAKSFYRLLGTLVGLIAMLTLISLFSQAHVLFILSLALWIGLCTFGSAHNRNFRAYGFVLAGYTAALIGITDAEVPATAFDSAVIRALEVSIGIICAALVSSIVLPSYAADALKKQVRLRFGAFVDFVAAAARGTIDRPAMDRRNTSFIGEVVGLEALRSFAVFEDPVSRLLGERIGRLNSESMVAATRFHALHQLLNRVYSGGHPVLHDALAPYLQRLADQLIVAGHPVQSAADAAQVSLQLARFQAALPADIRATRLQLPMQDSTLSDDDLLDFDTASELLYRFIADLRDYATTYASLHRRKSPAGRPHAGVDDDVGDDAPSHRDARHERARDALIRTRSPRYVAKTSPLLALIAACRAMIALLALTTFWIFSAWPSGDFAAGTAATICALISASPQPARAAIQTTAGALLATIVGYGFTFWLLPVSSGFVVMAGAIVPCLMIGPWLLTRRKWMAAGLGYCIFFCFLCGPDNLSSYDAASYLNNSVALITSLVVASVAFALILPPSSPILIHSMLRDLRRQVGMAGKGAMNGLMHRFETQTRDYMAQIGAFSAGKPVLQAQAMAWMLSVLEVGHALIELRAEFELLPAHAQHIPRYQPHAPWRMTMRGTRDAVVHLFHTPGSQSWTAACNATTEAIALTRAELQLLINAEKADTEKTTAEKAEIAHGAPDERHRLQRILSYLHFIRTALIDAQSPLAQYASLAP